MRIQTVQMIQLIEKMIGVKMKQKYLLKLTPPNFVDNSERQELYNFSHAEGNRPLSIFRDQYSEELACPGILLGQKRPNDKQQLKSIYYKTEIRSLNLKTLNIPT